MADVGTLTIKLGVNAQGLLEAETKVRQFADRVQNTASKIGPTLQEPFRLFSKQATAHLAMTSQRLRTFGYLASAAITAPMVLAGKSVMKMASEYEFSMQKIVGLTGTAQSVVDKWSDSIKSMSKDFGRKPQELAEGLYFIASSGIEGAQALDVLKVSAKAAATGLGETQDIANYLTSVLNAYRGTGLTAAYATDVLVAAVREGKAEAQGFAAAMGSITPLASNLGVSIDQVAGAMAAITLTGSTAAQSATYLRGVFNILMKETKQGAAAMDEASAALGQMKTSYSDLRKILREQGIMALMEKLNELSEAYGETLVSKVFPNIRAMLGVLSLSGKNMEYNTKIMKEITNSSGTLGKAFAAVSDTIKFKYDKAISSLQTSMISLGKSLATALLPILEGLVKRINRFAERFDALSESQKRFRIAVALGVAALGPFTMALSVLGYTLTGVMNLVNGLIKALTTLNGALTLVGISSAKAGAKFMVLRKIVNLKNFFGGGVGKILTTLKNPWTLAAAGAITATIAISKYAKKIKQIASDNELFNKSMVKVNESMKRFKDLSSIDYETMSLDQLVAAREEARKVWEDAFKLYKQYEKNLQAPMQSDKKNKKLMEDQAKKVEFAKQAYEGLGTAIENYQAKFTADRLAEQANAEEAVANAIREHNEALQEIWSTMLAEVNAVEEQAKVYAELGKSFNLVDEKANIYLRTIETLTGEKFKLKLDSSQIQTLMKWIKELNVDLSDLRKATDNYNDSLNAINMKKLLLGPSFDADTEKLKTHQEYLDEIIKSLSGKKLGEITLIDRQAIDEQLKLIEETRKRIDETTDRNTLKLLQAEADAFGNIAGQVEVLNFAVQAEERALRSMLKVFIEGSKTGEQVTWKQIQEAADRIQDLKIAYVDAQNAMDMQFLNDMNDALNNVSTNSELLQGHIDALGNKLKVLSENQQGSTEEFKAMATQMRNLTYAQEAVDMLSSAFTDLFRGLVEGGQNMGDVLKGIFNSILNEIMAVIAKMIAMKLIMAIFFPMKGAMKGIEVLGNLLPNLPLIGGGGYAARGGIVPPGFPNDTFPARLTSGEAIIPLSNLDKYDFGKQQVAVVEGDVRFEIEGETLVGILKKKAKKSSIY